jgi:type III restriction enzyme
MWTWRSRVSRFEPTKVRETNGNESDIPTYTKHLLCDEQGAYPAELNDWEKAVLRQETKRDGFRFWYRNPDRTSQDSLGIAWWLGDDAKIMRPDFIFFSEHDGAIVADLIDPHGVHLADALPKLKGLADYAATHEQTYRRIVAVAEVGGKLRMLDMTRAEVRAAVAAATNAHDLYSGALGNDYA